MFAPYLFHQTLTSTVSHIERRAMKSHFFYYYYYSQESPEISGAENEDLCLEGILEVIQ